MSRQPSGRAPAGQRIALLVAVADNGVIGTGNRLPWQLPDDLRRFKQLTLGHPVLMGRRTFESIGRPLPGRRNLVLSRDPRWHAHGVEHFDSLEAALAAVGDEPEVFVIGGEAVFEQALEYASRVYLTRVHARPAGDVRFPPLDPATWRRIAQQVHGADARHPVAFTFETWERRPGAGAAKAAAD